MSIIDRITTEFPQIAQIMNALPARFDPDWLMEAAQTELELDDFGPDSFMEPLTRLCESLNTEADLNPYGRLLITGILRTQLGNRLLLQRERTQNPARLTGELVAPIIVSGLPRTGTTFLHRLLAADPAHVSLPYWQLNRPIPRDATDTAETRVAAARALLEVRRAITPELDGTHLIRAESPEECMWLNGASMYTRIWWNVAPVYRFQHWYVRADKTAKYRDYRDLLSYLQTEYPGQRLVLKAPDHNDGLSELLDRIPEARVVLTHRDMADQVGSYLSLGRTTRKLAVNALDTQKETEAVLDMTDVSIQKMAEARKAHGNRILDLRYTDMMADPLAAIERIYQFCGLTLPEERRTALRDHHAANPKGKHGAHDYALADFGLTKEKLNDRYAGYEAKFVR